MTKNLKQKTAHAFAWSAVQSWGMKFFALLVFLILARYLSPRELGLATTVTLILAFVAVISEQGFPEAIMQRKGLTPDDLNLPFMISMITALFAAACLFFFSKGIGHFLRVDDAAPLIVISAVIPPITAAISFESAMRKRSLDFKSLAKASLISSLLAGGMAIVLAANAYGALSLVIQAVATAAITSVLLWRERTWTPSQRISISNFKEIFAYSSNAFGSRLLDFFSGRVMDFIILGKYGVAALGLYTVGSKLYLTVLQLLASAMMDVALSAMSRISADLDRMKSAYLRFIFLAGCTTSPLFFAMAALAPEICSLLFGDKWAGVDKVMQWLCLLGAVQVVQYFNGAVMGAVGNSRGILVLNVIKLLSGLTVMIFSNADSISQLALYFALSQLACSPISFMYAIRATSCKWKEIFGQVLPGLISSLMGLLAVNMARSILVERDYGVFVTIVTLAAVYLAVMLTILILTCFQKLSAELQYVFSAYVRR